MKRYLLFLLTCIITLSSLAGRNDIELPLNHGDQEELKGYVASSEDNTPNSKVDPRVYYPRQVSRYERPTTGGDILIEAFDTACFFVTFIYSPSSNWSLEGAIYSEKLYIRLNVFRI